MNFKTTLLILTLSSFASSSAMDSNLNDKAKQQLWQINITPKKDTYTTTATTNVKQGSVLSTLTQQYNQLKLKNDELKLKLKKLSNDLRKEKNRHLTSTWIQKVYKLLDELQRENKINPDLASQLKFQGRFELGNMYSQNNQFIQNQLQKFVTNRENQYKDKEWKELYINQKIKYSADTLRLYQVHQDTKKKHSDFIKKLQIKLSDILNQKSFYRMRDLLQNTNGELTKYIGKYNSNDTRFYTPSKEETKEDEENTTITLKIFHKDYVAMLNSLEVIKKEFLNLPENANKVIALDLKGQKVLSSIEILNDKLKLLKYSYDNQSATDGL